MNPTLNSTKATSTRRLLRALAQLGFDLLHASPRSWAKVRSRTARKTHNRLRITLTWADSHLRRRVIDLATETGMQTTYLTRMPHAKIAVLCCADGRIAGWAGMDVETDPEHPEVFSGFVCPEFRGLGLGTLLEHVWWAYLSAWGYKTAYMRMECGAGQRLVRHWLETGYCRPTFDDTPATPFQESCRVCELFAATCSGCPYLVVDVEKALAVSVRRTGPVDICRLPLRLNVETPTTPTARPGERGPYRMALS
ncbi:MAG: GNAT family N-acetyltransferase [Candidatus Thiodiazotropha sp.]